MHELSIACSLVDAVSQDALRAGATRVLEVHLRLGALAGVVEDSLQFSYDIVTRGTPLEGSKLIVERLPVLVYCAACNDTKILPGIQSFRCPVCSAPTGDVRGGREMEVASIVAETDVEETA